MKTIYNKKIMGHTGERGAKGGGFNINSTEKKDYKRLL